MTWILINKVWPKNHTISCEDIFQELYEFDSKYYIGTVLSLII
jgi:hypothetical protein